MKYYTFNEIKNKVRRDLGLEQEEFVTNVEMMGYVNSAIDEAEAEILTIYEDYFLAKPVAIDIVSGQKEYELPENIYASKIRGVVYVDGTDIYPVREFKEREDFWEHVEITDVYSDDTYNYIIYNDGPSSKPTLNLYPTPIRSVVGGLKLRYIRNAAYIENNTDVVDIPEFANFVIQYCKVRCYEKEGNPKYTAAANKLEFYRQQMIDTLTDKVPDGDNTIALDLDFYTDTV